MTFHPLDDVQMSVCCFLSFSSHDWNIFKKCTVVVQDPNGSEFPTGAPEGKADEGRCTDGESCWMKRNQTLVLWTTHGTHAKHQTEGDPSNLLLIGEKPRCEATPELCAQVGPAPCCSIVRSSRSARPEGCASSESCDADRALFRLVEKTFAVFLELKGLTFLSFSLKFIPKSCVSLHVHTWLNLFLPELLGPLVFWAGVMNIKEIPHKVILWSWEGKCSWDESEFRERNRLLEVVSLCGICQFFDL